MDLKTFIQVRSSSEFIHFYPDAPEEVAFLREPHRHILQISAEIEVFTSDRELEFIIVKRELEKWLKQLELTTPTSRSCEDIGLSINTINGLYDTEVITFSNSTAGIITGASS